MFTTETKILARRKYFIVMTCLFADIHEEDHHDFIKNRVPNANFDEVLFADDTICFSQSPDELNHFLHRIEIHSKNYGLQLNEDKCELSMGPQYDLLLRWLDSWVDAKSGNDQLRTYFRIIAC